MPAQHFEDDPEGSIEVGKLADVAILSDVPLSVVTEDIGNTVAMETIKEDRTVWRRP